MKLGIPTKNNDFKILNIIELETLNAYYFILYTLRNDIFKYNVFDKNYQSTILPILKWITLRTIQIYHKMYIHGRQNWIQI